MVSNSVDNKVIVELYYHRDTARDQQSFIEVFEEFGSSPTINYTIANKADCADCTITASIEVTFSSSSYFKEFLSKLGSNSYNILKKELNKLLLKHVENENATYGKIQLKTNDTESNIVYIFNGVFLTEEDLNKLFSNTNSLYSLILENKKSNNHPFNKKCNTFNVNVNFLIYDELVIQINRYEKKENETIHSDSFNSQITIKNLNELKWNKIKWGKNNNI